MDSTWVRTSIC